MRRNPPGYRLFKRSELEKFLEFMESPIADIVSVIQVAGVTRPVGLPNVTGVRLLFDNLFETQ